MLGERVGTGHERVVVELARREVHGHGDVVAEAGRAPGGELGARLVEHPRAEAADQPVSSAVPMNSSGPTSPRSGCCQRTSASTPPIERSASRTSGW